MSLGKDILAAQLNFLRERHKTVDPDCIFGEGEKEKLQQLVKAFEVDEKFEPAFNAYYMDYILDCGQATNEAGVFYNDEDIKTGIYEKLYHFYQPIANLLMQRNPDIVASLHIEPFYDDSSTVLVLAENRYGKNILPVSLVLLKSHHKVWYPFFDTPTGPENVYVDLALTFTVMEKNLKQVLEPPAA